MLENAIYSYLFGTRIYKLDNDLTSVWIIPNYFEFGYSNYFEFGYYPQKCSYHAFWIYP